MRKFVTMFVGAAVLGAVPATAQGWRPDGRVNREISQDIGQLDRQIDRAEQRRTVSRREAAKLRRQADQIDRSYRRFQRGGLSREEVRSLEQQVNRLRQQLRLERRDWDGRRG